MDVLYLRARLSLDSRTLVLFTSVVSVTVGLMSKISIMSLTKLNASKLSNAANLKMQN